MVVVVVDGVDAIVGHAADVVNAADHVHRSDGFLGSMATASSASEVCRGRRPHRVATSEGCIGSSQPKAALGHRCRGSPRVVVAEADAASCGNQRSRRVDASERCSRSPQPKAIVGHQSGWSPQVAGAEDHIGSLRSKTAAGHRIRRLWKVTRCSHRRRQLTRFNLINAHCYGLGFWRRWGCWRSLNG